MPEKRSNDNSTSRRITLVDVARHAGVSRATASLVVRNSPLVAEETRQRVLDSMQKLGYVYNRGAARLRTQQSFTIGVIVLDISNPFFAELTLGAEEQLEASGYVALLANTADDAGRQSRLLDIVLEHGVDGVLLCPAQETPPELIASLHRKLPVVQFVRSLPGIDVDYVGADHEHGTKLGVDHLIMHGHQRIAYIGGPMNSSARQERLDGYYEALQYHDLTVDESLVVAGPGSRASGYNAILRLLEHPDPPTAAMCYNDVVAFGVMLGLQTVGRAPGEDFGIVGFDNIADAATWHPALTTISGDPREIGKVAASQLLERLNNPALEINRIILPTTLIMRESCGIHKP